VHFFSCRSPFFPRVSLSFSLSLFPSSLPYSRLFLFPLYFSRCGRNRSRERIFETRAWDFERRLEVRVARVELRKKKKIRREIFVKTNICEHFAHRRFRKNCDFSRGTKSRPRKILRRCLPSCIFLYGKICLISRGKC